MPILVEKEGGRLALEPVRPYSIGRVKAFSGNFGVLVRALAYILAYGPGVRQATEDAVLNANYIRKQLEGVYELPYSLPSMHEVVFSDAIQKKNGVSTMDIAKRLIDYGFHPYTTAFPLIVPGALMIEPTESESKEECDLFIDAMKAIAEEAASKPEIVKTEDRAAHHARPPSRRSRRCSQTGLALEAGRPAKRSRGLSEEENRGTGTRQPRFPSRRTFASPRDHLGVLFARICIDIFFSGPKAA